MIRLADAPAIRVGVGEGLPPGGRALSSALEAGATDGSWGATWRRGRGAQCVPCSRSLSGPRPGSPSSTADTCPPPLLGRTSAYLRRWGIMPNLLARRCADDRGEKARALVGGAGGEGAVSRREQWGGFPIATGGTVPRFSHLPILHPKISNCMPLSMPHVHVGATWTHDGDVDERVSPSRRTTTPTSIRFLGRDIAQCRRRRRAGTRARGVGTEGAATWGKGDRTTTCATKYAAVRRTAAPRSEKRAGERRRLRVLASSTSTESERNARTDPDGAALRKGNRAANHVPSTSSITNSNGETSGEPSDDQKKSPDIRTLWNRFIHVAAPYWSSEDKTQARLRVAAVFLMTLATTGISVAFNFLGRDFYNALSSKDQEQFTKQLLYYLGAFVVGIPVFVIRDYLRETLALRWRAWMTKEYIGRYFSDRTFYNIQSASLIDNPDQRIVDDIASFTVTSLAFALAIFNACIDLISFSGILYGIYPPLFGVLIVYSLGGTALSVALGKGLVGLNFMQEKREADFRYGLVRVRENAESIAFYGGETNEINLLLERFKLSFQNYTELLISSRNLDFFTSGYKYLIQLLPAAVVAPLYFSGKIEFGVISQSFSAFNHVLSDFSIIVFQFQAISSFSAVVDRLGEFTDLLEESDKQRAKREGGGEEEEEVVVLRAVDGQDEVVERSIINLIDSPYRGCHQVLGRSVATSSRSEMASAMRYAAAAADDDDDEGVNSRQELSQDSTRSDSSEDSPLRPRRIFRESAAPSSQDAAVLLEIEDLTLFTPQYTNRLILNLSLTIREGEHLLIMGPSGSGKTSLLRAIAGLWRAGKGTIRRHIAVDDPSDARRHNESSSTSEVIGNRQLAATRILDSSRGEAKKGETDRRERGSERRESSSSRGLVFFLPQRPYMVLGTLRQQLLYPTWSSNPTSKGDESFSTMQSIFSKAKGNEKGCPGDEEQEEWKGAQGKCPSDDDLKVVLRRVMLEPLLDRYDGLDSNVDWASVLSLGEQQRLAFGRLLLSPARLALMDESTSALDAENEANLYNEVKKSGITMVSVGHRSSLLKYHDLLLKCVSTTQERSGNMDKAWRLLPTNDLTPPVQMEILQEEEEQEEQQKQQLEQQV